MPRSPTAMTWAVAVFRYASSRNSICVVIMAPRINQKETAHADDDAASRARADRVDFRDLVLAVRHPPAGDARRRARSRQGQAQGRPGSAAGVRAADRRQLQPPARTTDGVLCAG